MEESPVQRASTGHEKHVFGGAPAVNRCSVSLRSSHSLGLRDEQGGREDCSLIHSFVWLFQVNRAQQQLRTCLVILKGRDILISSNIIGIFNGGA